MYIIIYIVDIIGPCPNDGSSSREILNDTSLVSSVVALTDHAGSDKCMLLFATKYFLPHIMALRVGSSDTNSVGEESSNGNTLIKSSTGIVVSLIKDTDYKVIIKRHATL